MNKLWKIVGYIFSVISLSFATDSNAFVVCPAQVTAVGLTPDGTIFANFNFSGTVIQYWLCNTTGSTTVTVSPGTNLTIPSAACQALFSQLMTARASSGSVNLFFAGPTSCAPSALPSSVTVPNPYPGQIIF